MEKKTMQRLWKLVTDEDAATAVEYAVMLALIILACIGAVSFLGTNASNAWESNSNAIGGSMGHVQ
tara:strand:- start:216 stop:413 length:198 start_codon:yes stop_codon:yes gene_type:complete